MHHGCISRFDIDFFSVFNVFFFKSFLWCIYCRYLFLLLGVCINFADFFIGKNILNSEKKIKKLFEIFFYCLPQFRRAYCQKKFKKKINTISVLKQSTLSIFSSFFSYILTFVEWSACYNENCNKPPKVIHVDAFDGNTSTKIIWNNK